MDKCRVKKAGWSHDIISANVGIGREDLQGWECVLRVGQKELFESWVVWKGEQ